MRILINTISTKKYAGGALQIAYNFLLKTLEHPEIEWYYITSSDLDSIIREHFMDKLGKQYFVFPTQPDYKKSYFKVKKELKLLEKQINPDVVYSVTAPSYFTFKTPEVIRFTNPWITHPNEYSWKVLTATQKLRTKVYCWNQIRMMRKVKFFVTQTETIKEGILRITSLPDDHVKVVRNVLPFVFASMDKTLYEPDQNWIDIACVAAPSPHKNINIIPDVLKYLKNRGIVNVRFNVTIPFDNPLLSILEKKLDAYGIKDCMVNHGRISQTDLAEMYRHCQISFLPTLLEVFSVSSIEAMFFDLKIVATDFQFNREVMDDSCLYYKPMDANHAAIQIAKIISDKSLQEKLSAKMKKQLTVYDNYDNHFNAILEYIRKVAIT